MAKAATKAPPDHRIETVTLTPEAAMALLEHNRENRPLRDTHVRRIARQIIEGKWRFNGDTIKISDDGNVLDGQHRLWAVIESKQSVETIVVHGIARDAFSTIDTIRAPRHGADILALNGVATGRLVIAQALTWLLRWQRNAIVTWRDPNNKIENSDIEAALAAHPGIIEAYDATLPVRSLGPHAVITFLYYVLSNRNQDLADRMIATLRDPAGAALDDPFFRLRAYFTTDHHLRKNTVVTIANAIKAINAAWRGARIKVLNWKGQGERAEAFPTLEVK